MSIISLAASSSADVSRSVEFFVKGTRVNTVISRARSKTYLLDSPPLFDQLPKSVDQLAELGRFAGPLKGDKSTTSTSDGTLPTAGR